MLIDPTKNGTIILSYYRSGGTQLKSILVDMAWLLGLTPEDGGEIDVELEHYNFSQNIDNYFSNKCNGNYSIILLNNPFVVNYLYVNDSFKYLGEDFNIVYLERRDKVKSLLSLALWEEFIATGLYSKSSKTWTKKAMAKFHNKLLKKPIPYYNVYLGNHIEFSNQIKPEHYINTIFYIFTTHFTMLRSLAEKYATRQLYYEDYEDNAHTLYDEVLEKQVKEMGITEDKVRQFKALLQTSKVKIPYPSNNYSDYYDEYVKDGIKQWNLKSL